MKKIFFYISIITSTIAFFTYIAAMISRISLLPIIVILSLISIAVYFCTKHLYTDIQQKLSIINLGGTVLTVLWALIYEILYKLYAGVSNLIMENAQSGQTLLGSLPPEAIEINIIEAKERVLSMGATLIIIAIIINIALLVLIIYKARRSGSIKEIISCVNKINITKLKMVFAKTEKTEKEDIPDVIVCKDPKNGKPVMLPYKDRFLHTLILGATGSGKTSQTILPFINQDMQKICGITVIDPKGDLAEKVWAMGEHYGRNVVYFNPVLDNCPFFNPLYGPEDTVVENMSTTFKMLNPDSPQFFLDQNDNLIRNALKVLKRLEEQNKADANFINLNRILYNTNGEGRKLIIAFSKISNIPEDTKKENDDLAGWFLDDYYKEKSKTYEHCSGLRSQVSKIISNKHLRRVLNPPRGVNDVNFEKQLEGGILSISTAQGELGDLGRYLGYFIILQFQSAVFKRPGKEENRLAHMLYIDEFQEFSNPGFGRMLTQGRSYRVASHLATQNRDLMAMGGGKDGQNFVRLVDTNARNLIIYPGGNYGDADYYSRKFGEVSEVVGRERAVAKKGALGLNTGIDRTVTTEETKKARFSPTEIMYRPFGEITYALIINNSIQPPGVGKIDYIPMDLNIKLDQMVDDLKEGKITQSIMNQTNIKLEKEDTKTINTQTRTGIDYNISIPTDKKIDIPDTLFEVDKEINLLSEEDESAVASNNQHSNESIEFDFDFEFGDFDNNEECTNTENFKENIDIINMNEIKKDVLVSDDDDDESDDLF